MMGHKICFYGEILLMIPELSLLPLIIWSTALIKALLSLLVYIKSIVLIVLQR